jgi:hypothetical protein
MPLPAGTRIVPSARTSIAGLDEIGREISLARRDVTRQREARQGRQVQVVRATDARFRASPRATAEPACRRGGMDGERRRESPESARLDVDDPAGSEIERVDRGLRTVNRFVRQIGVRNRFCNCACCTRSS